MLTVYLEFIDYSYYVICDLWNEPIGSLMIGLNNIDDCGINGSSYFYYTSRHSIHLKKQKIIIWNGVCYMFVFDKFDAMRVIIMH